MGQEWYHVFEVQAWTVEIWDKNNLKPSTYFIRDYSFDVEEQ